MVGEQMVFTSLDAQPSGDDRGDDLPTECAHHTVGRGDGATPHFGNICVHHHG